MSCLPYPKPLKLEPFQDKERKGGLMDFNISRDYARTHVTHSLTTTELKEKKRKKIVKPN